jgi:type VI secretion system secreted protein Hcp
MFDGGSEQRSTHMAGYIKFEGNDGESKDREHKGWTDILSMEQTIHKPTPPGATGVQRRRADTVCEDIVVQLVIDKVFPKLGENLCKGKVFPKVEIQLTRSYTDTGRAKWLAYELKNVLVTSFSAGGQCQSSEIPSGEVHLNYEEIKLTYFEADESGKEKGSVPMTWKVEEGES